MERQGHLNAAPLQCVVIYGLLPRIWYSSSGDHADVCDGAMILLAMLTLNLFHPGIYLPGDDDPSSTGSEGGVLEVRLETTPNLEKAA